MKGLREHLDRDVLEQGTEGFIYEDGDDVAEEEQQVAGLMNATGLNGGDEMDEEIAEDSEIGAEEKE